MKFHLTGEKRKQSMLSHIMCFCAYRLQDRYLCPRNITRLRQALAQYFKSSSFSGTKCGDASPDAKADELDSMGLNLFLLPYKVQDESQRCQYESFMSTLGKLRDQVVFYFILLFTLFVFFANCSFFFPLMESLMVFC